MTSEDDAAIADYITRLERARYMAVVTADVETAHMLTAAGWSTRISGGEAQAERDP